MVFWKSDTKVTNISVYTNNFTNKTDEILTQSTDGYVLSLPKIVKMLKKSSLFVLICCVGIIVKAQPAFQLVNFASGFSSPVDIANAGDERIFIVEREGYIKIVDLSGTVYADNFLDIHTQIESGYQEQGLLGLAFHPDYADNGFFYVYYTDLDGNTVVSRYQVSTFNPDIADPTTELILFTADQPFVNHNGGCIKFGPDGYLYIGLGDGGSAGDPGNRAQNAENKLGKMHRIDVDGGTPYAIPADNPFATATDTLKEIWAIGYRNPWRYSFDRLTGNMWVGDVGQNLQEEVDVELAGDGGHNYGWRCYEGFDVFNDAGCDDDGSDYTFPILQYPHNYTTGGFSITGGYVYRGTEFPGMYGYYMFADYVSGNWWWVNADAGAPYIYEREDDVEGDIAVFGEDVNGEIYCGDLASGIIYHVTDACGSFVLNTVATDYTCGAGTGSIDLSIIDGAAPYTIEWSTGATSEDITGLAEGTYTVTVTDNAGCERMAVVAINENPGFVVTVTNVGNTLSADAGTSWQWYLNGVLIEGATAQTYDATETGNYYVVATDDNGCIATSAAVDFTVGIKELLHQDLLIYPNPTTGIFTIELPENANGNLIIYNLVGDKIYTQEITSNPIQINMAGFSNGLYTIELENKNTLFTQTLILGK